MNSIFYRLLNKGQENMSTEALLYLLNRYGELNRCFLRELLGNDLCDELANWSSQEYDTRCFFDLYYESETACVIIENKFYGAEFTPDQSSKYLRQIAGRGKELGILVMLVPHKYQQYYREKIKKELKGNKINYEADNKGRMICEVPHNDQKVKVPIEFITWASLLHNFESVWQDEALAPNDGLVILEHLKGFHDEMTDSYTEFKANDCDPGNAELFTRIITTVEKMREKMWKKNGMPATSGTSEKEKYFGFFFEEKKFWVGFSTYRWLHHQNTPFWFQVLDPRLIKRIQASPNLIENTDYFYRPGIISFPLPITAGLFPETAAEKFVQRVMDILKNLQALEKGTPGE